jgi:hypothetical protein
MVGRYAGHAAQSQDSVDLPNSRLNIYWALVSRPCLHSENPSLRHVESLFVSRLCANLSETIKRHCCSVSVTPARTTRHDILCSSEPSTSYQIICSPHSRIPRKHVEYSCFAHDPAFVARGNRADVLFPATNRALRYHAW